MKTPPSLSAGLFSLFAIIVSFYPPLGVAQETYNPPQAIQDLKGGNFDAISENCAILRRGKDPSFKSNLYNIYSALGRKESLGKLKEWVKKVPDSAVAQACLGLAYIREAHKDMKKGNDGRFTDTQNETDQQNLSQAKSYLAAACDLIPDDPNFWAIRMSLSRSVPNSEKEMEMSFQKGIRSNPDYLPLFTEKMTYLSPLWRGNLKAMKDFTYRSVNGAKSGSKIKLLIVAYHDSIRGLTDKDRSYFTEGHVWEEMEKAFKTYLRAHPGDISVRTWYAMDSLKAEKNKTACQQFEILKEDDWMLGGWKDRKSFQETKKHVLEALGRNPNL